MYSHSVYTPTSISQSTVLFMQSFRNSSMLYILRNIHYTYVKLSVSAYCTVQYAFFKLNFPIIHTIEVSFPYRSYLVSTWFPFKDLSFSTLPLPFLYHLHFTFPF
jgi:hypothetical protein